MLCKVTHCAGRVSANTRPHQLRWGDREMGTYVYDSKCSSMHVYDSKCSSMHVYDSKCSSMHVYDSKCSSMHVYDSKCSSMHVYMNTYIQYLANFSTTLHSFWKVAHMYVLGLQTCAYFFVFAKLLVHCLRWYTHTPLAHEKQAHTIVASILIFFIEINF